MKKEIFLWLAILGAVVTYIPLTYYILANDYSFSTIYNQLFTYPLVVFLLFDLLCTCIVFWVYLYREVATRQIKYWQIALASNFLIGLCVAFPLFLYFRARAIEQEEQK